MIWALVYCLAGVLWLAVWGRLGPRLGEPPGHPHPLVVGWLWWLHLSLVLVAATTAGLLWLWFLPARRRARRST